MLTEKSINERFTLLESRVEELERQRLVQEDRDLALLARIDNFIDDLRRIERVQMRSFETIMAHQKEQDNRLASLETKVDGLESTVATLVDAAKDHKQAIESLAQGQQQILAILTGGRGRND